MPFVRFLLEPGQSEDRLLTDSYRNASTHSRSRFVHYDQSNHMLWNNNLVQSISGTESAQSPITGDVMPSGTHVLHDHLRFRCYVTRCISRAQKRMDTIQ